MSHWSSTRKLLLAAFLSCSGGAALAQSLPVSVDVAGRTATATIAVPGLTATAPLAEVTLTFDETASALVAPDLGIRAELVDLTDPDLLARLPGQLVGLDPALPLLVTIEPSAASGFSFRRTVHVEVHTHALVYEAGSSYRLFKSHGGEPFRDITDEIAPGSVRARGTTGGFSQFLVLADLRPTDQVITAKTAWLRNRIDLLPASEQGAFDSYLDATEAAVARGDYAGAIASLDQIRARAASRADRLGDEWRATNDSTNNAGELIAGAATLKYSVAYQRDYGR
jgi:hypothetical protein